MSHFCLQNREYVVNIISDWFVEAANYTCGDYDRGLNEMELAGLTPVPSLKVKPPRVGESAIQMECKLRQVVNFEGRCVWLAKGRMAGGLILNS